MVDINERWGAVGTPKRSGRGCSGSSVRSARERLEPGAAPICDEITCDEHTIARARLISEDTDALHDRIVRERPRELLCGEPEH